MVEIRNYADGDLETCRTLWVHLTEWHRTIYDAPNIGGDNPGLQFDDHLAKIGRERIWLAVDNGEVVGMTGLEPGAEEGDLQIEPLVVVPGARGSGVGKALVTHVIDVIKELGLGELNVRVVGRNTSAIQFYHELGFDKIGFLELFFDTREGADQRWHEGETIADRHFRV